MDWKVDFASAFVLKYQYRITVGMVTVTVFTLQVLLSGNYNGHNTRETGEAFLVRHKAGEVGAALHDLVFVLRMAVRRGGLCWLLESGDDVGCVDTLGFLCVFIVVELKKHSEFSNISSCFLSFRIHKCRSYCLALLAWTFSARLKER